ncbi:ATP-dependent DNA helicase UvrD/PcrA [Hyphomicrobium sulfonivorans]|uniref:ATP-dependent DNA helicase UvrD/PcrA n=1 Tax=Hyphomicrobium sulfonivorans TaxID=121290 RepID=A0A120CT84_HYPSL|nr:ATP-dependent helicase [Hyphomicrobium sulfonivorans]KWT64245.1 ATP-dependent DNA helicase UvrD/PcrA [Hyphomicrobium sulfonivorans]
MIVLSQEQQDVVDAAISPLCVIACAGSGKTTTAVRRLIKVREALNTSRGRVALLSYSNVAVDTFRDNYDELMQPLGLSRCRSLVEIDTLDAFFSRNLLAPHGHRVMKSKRAAFLLHGGEGYLAGQTCGYGKDTRPITKAKVRYRNGKAEFYRSENGNNFDLPPATVGAIEKLGRSGGYTHDLGRYWCHRLLVEYPELLRAFARRYPQIIIDEAQDIGSAHQMVLDLLIAAGSVVSLIGDPDQSIYAFADADGQYLRDYASRSGVATLAITQNRRSIPKIVNAASKLAGRSDAAIRSPLKDTHGVFLTSYKKGEEQKLIDAFKLEVASEELAPENSAVLTRARELADTLGGKKEALGQGLTQRLAHASLLRDRDHDYEGAFREVVAVFSSLIEDGPDDLVTQLTAPSRQSVSLDLKRQLWSFTRNPDDGLPSATLPGSSEWHPKMFARVKEALKEIAQRDKLNSTSNLGNRLAKTKLTAEPLLPKADLAKDTSSELEIRVDTVHKAKGESLDAVLYWQVGLPTVP